MASVGVTSHASRVTTRIVTRCLLVVGIVLLSKRLACACHDVADDDDDDDERHEGKEET